MKKFLILLLLLPFFVFSQQKKQKRVCVPSRTQVIVCCDSPKVVVNVAPPSHLILEPDLKKAIIDKLSQKDKGDFWDTFFKWLAAVSPVLIAWVAYKFARRQSRFDNLLKTDIEWIKDFRVLASQVLADLHSLMLLIDVVDSKEDALDQVRSIHLQQNTPQSQTKVHNARSEMDAAFNELFAKYSQSLRPLMELKLSLSDSQDHQTLITQIDTLYEKRSQQKVLEPNDVEVVVSNIRIVIARQRTEIERRA